MHINVAHLVFVKTCDLKHTSRCKTQVIYCKFLQLQLLIQLVTSKGVLLYYVVIANILLSIVFSLHLRSQYNKIQSKAHLMSETLLHNVCGDFFQTLGNDMLYIPDN